MSKKKNLHIYLSGKVQGVGFRAFIRQNAKNLSLKGWAKNLSDGRVEVVLSGTKSKLDKILELLEEGPRFARVHNIEVEEKEYQDKYSNFKIKY